MLSWGAAMSEQKTCGMCQKFIPSGIDVYEMSWCLKRQEVIDDDDKACKDFEPKDTQT